MGTYYKCRIVAHYTDSALFVVSINIYIIKVISPAIHNAHVQKKKKIH